MIDNGGSDLSNELSVQSSKQMNGACFRSNVIQEKRTDGFLQDVQNKFVLDVILPLERSMV